MRTFLSVFFAILAAAAVLWGVMSYRAAHNREVIRTHLQTSKARDALAGWQTILERETALIQRGSGFTPVDNFLEAYRSIAGWIVELPAAERTRYEKLLATARANALAGLRKGGPEWEAVDRATRP